MRIRITPLRARTRITVLGSQTVKNKMRYTIQNNRSSAITTCGRCTDERPEPQQQQEYTSGKLKNNKLGRD